MFAMALGLAACSTDEADLVNGGSDGDYQTNYLAVRLVPSPSTRAEEEAPGSYADGTTTENEVKSLRFYFFDADGNAVAVKSNSGGKQNYYDVNPLPESAGKDKPNVEKILKATLIINTEAGDDLPASVVAVINGSSSGTTNLFPTLTTGTSTEDDLVDMVADYSSTTNGFLMTNSVYADDANKVKIAVDVAGHLRNSAAAAEAAPVDIYVERVLAKATLEFTTGETLTSVEGTIDGESGTPTQHTFYKVVNSETGATDFKSKDIYIKVNGWKVTASTAESRLVKKINPTDWTNLFSEEEPWNWAPYFRSFWAQNPTTLTTPHKPTSDTDNGNGSYNYFTYKEVTKALGTGVDYMQENAADVNADMQNKAMYTKNPTQVIVAAQLYQMKAGQENVFEPLKIYEWGFEQKQGDETDLLNAFASMSEIYIKTTEGVQGQEGYKETYTQITGADLKLVPAEKVGKADPVTDGRYYVYVQIDTYDGSKNYVIGKAKDTENATETAINASLLTLGGAKIWKDGMTYYYFDIRHLAKDPEASAEDVSKIPGYYGVVRNHVYKSAVTKIAGLGTPVFDPDIAIYPEKPKEEDTYIAARINILSWRVVDHDYELEW